MRSLLFLVMILLCLQFTASKVNGQVASKLVTVNYTSQTIEEILKDLGAKYGVKFSYSSNYVPLKKKVSISVTQQPLSEVLKKVLVGTGTTFTEVGNQIVIKKVISTNQKKTPTSDKKNINKEEDAIAEPFVSAIKPKDSTPVEQAMVSIAEEPVFFEEPHIQLPESTKDTVDRVALKKIYKAEKRKLKKQFYAKLDSIDNSADKSSKGKLQNDFNRVVRKLEAEINTIGDSLNLLNNRSDSLQRERSSGKDSNQYFHRTAQATFVTPIGTNGLNSTQTVNNVSFNFAGQAAGLEGFELGLIFNGESDYVRGAQISGIGNLVGSEMRGAQIAPVFNMTGGYTEGAQISGFMNWASDSTFAFQAAGFINYVGRQANGAQFAGFTNIVKGSFNGTHAAGFCNVVTGDTKGGQMSGFLNTTAGNAKGAQIAGFMNVVGDTLDGVQIAGFMNYGKIVRGSQISVFNIADSVTGAQIGFFNFCRKGYRRVELYGGEALHANLAFKTGTKKMYTIFAVGARTDLDDLTWAGGYGLGTLFDLSKTISMNLDLMCYYVHLNSQKWEELNLLNQAKLQMAINFTKHTSLFFGPSFNVSVSDQYNKEKGTYGMPFVPDWKFQSKTYSDGWNVSMWIGGNIGMRF